MASRRPLAWISGALAELPVGDTVAGHVWYFGSGEPNAAAGVVGEYYVEANNRLWVKGASAWTYTGVQLGSPANVDGKAVLVDADVLSIGDSANSLQMRQVTIADFKTQFLSTALADAAASPDLPSTSAATWQSIVQTLRNGLKWLMSRFNSAGQLAPAYGGTGTNDLANLPISNAVALALMEKVDKAFRATPIGSQNTAQSATWRSIGVVSLSGSDTAKITLLGTGGYGDFDACSGETVIHIRGTNDTTGRGLEGHFFGHSQGNGTISAVCVVRLDGNRWRVYVLAGQYMALSGVCDTSTSFAPENIDTGSGAQPENSRLLPSLWSLMLNGRTAVQVDQGGVTVLDRSIIVPNGRGIYGPNSWGIKLAVGGSGVAGLDKVTTSSVSATNGNVHIDATNSNGDSIYHNFYAGSGGTKFCDGNQGIAASVNSAGEWTGTNIHFSQDNAYELGSTNARCSIAYFGSNPVVTSDARLKLDLRPALSLDFVLALRPQSYRLMDAKVTVDTEHDGYEDVQEQVHEMRKVGGAEIVIVDGKPVRKTLEREERVPVFDLLPVMDEAGEPVLDGHDQPLMHPVPRMHTVRRAKTRQVRSVSEGVRRHHGLLAQQVLEVLEAQGLTSLDFAGLIRDEEADTWGLRYEQFIAPLIASIQSLSRKLDASEAERIQLIGQVAQLQNTVDRLLLSGGAQQ